MKKYIIAGDNRDLHRVVRDAEQWIDTINFRTYETDTMYKSNYSPEFTEDLSEKILTKDSVLKLIELLGTDLEFYIVSKGRLTTYNFSTFSDLSFIAHDKSVVIYNESSGSRVFVDTLYLDINCAIEVLKGNDLNAEFEGESK